MSQLIDCESQGNPKAVNWNDAKITGYPSRGILQFQEPTFLNEGKLYGLLPADFTLKESNMLINNPELQKEIARNMLRDGKLKQWGCHTKVRVAMR